MKPNPRVDSALHVLKGAVQKVLGASLTTSVFAEGDKGRLTVEFGRKPTDEEAAEMERLSNEKIREDVPIEKLEMGRDEAEVEFGDAIYDRFPVPDHVRRLSIARIRDWNVNCCLGPHLPSTGGIGKLAVRKCRHRAGRGELEISFALE
jgi:alanyl-tRNA synthetase